MRVATATRSMYPRARRPIAEGRLPKTIRREAASDGSGSVSLRSRRLFTLVKCTVFQRHYHRGAPVGVNTGVSADVNYGPRHAEGRSLR